mmetsp:Transcript_75606/g.177518  ORF Transcript_75606/g.177518 Transcript_75606/m.177518 type:complete len:209 (-) Transcript_75606:343-969(-)
MLLSQSIDTKRVVPHRTHVSTVRDFSTQLLPLASKTVVRHTLPNTSVPPALKSTSLSKTCIPCAAPPHTCEQPCCLKSTHIALVPHQRRYLESMWPSVIDSIACHRATRDLSKHTVMLPADVPHLLSPAMARSLSLSQSTHILCAVPNRSNGAIAPESTHRARDAPPRAVRTAPFSKAHRTLCCTAQEQRRYLSKSTHIVLRLHLCCT